MPGALPLLLLATLAQAPAVSDAGEVEGPLHLRAALELTAGAEPPPATGALQDGAFVSVLPLLALDGGEALGLEVGAPLRLRLQGATDGSGTRAGGLRREDWDERSDFGQLLRELRLGAPDGALSLRAGPLPLATLGQGRLVSRYANTLAADYHPAGASAALHAGPVRVEALASDVLALRLLAAEARVDLARALGAGAGAWERVHAAASLAYDGGRAHGRTAALSAGAVDLDAAVYRGARAQLWALAGVGARLDATGGTGAALGLALEAQPRALAVGAKVELRRQAGGFRHGLFGADLELARFSATGLAEAPLSGQLLPPGYAGYAELHLATGDAEGEAAETGRLGLSLAAEHFAFGRTDVDASLLLQLPGGRASATLRALATDLGERPRYALQAEARVRLAPALYAVASGGTVHTPTAAGVLTRGLYAAAGLGLDFAR
ncbi:hypothetical protein FGE12_04870 [Aggregicoccus sp. 17bor-14]|uniref:hypothetical protein n=1 Tax=Myxococcaceae TaxID=31 RepID=UPI00129C525D|nr:MULTISPECIES: hypothetical protein [Myxococcaceae]MBF5041712.1 hypothetical protein [Simulacricoccus sp. 17bor-14]MRI87493.1 hypothetical protein [Aggregicoccus sp. 17bor-14]